MRLLKFALSFLICFSAIFSTYGQDDYSHIKKAFPNWKTNFNNKNIDLNELRSGGPPKDGIPAIIKPRFITPNEAAEWLSDNEPVIFLEVNGKAKAYPLQILIWHEIVNDIINDVHVIVTFCPLCYSAIVFERTLLGVVTQFGVSGLLRNSDMVMYDQLTESFWQQFTGEAIVGDMTGEILKMMPSQIISFAQFKMFHKDGLVLSQETGFTRNYGSNPYIGYDDINQTPFLYDGPTDERLKPNEKVIAVKSLDYHKAYPYSISRVKNVINDSIGTKKIVVFHSEGAASALDQSRISDSKDVGSTGVFSRLLDGKEINFFYKDGYFYDEKTESKWNIIGKAIEGIYDGKSLEIIPHGDYFAFAWFAFVPETEIYSIK